MHAGINRGLVLSGWTTNVDTVMVDGVILDQEGKMIDLDTSKILDEAQDITEEIWGSLFSERPELGKMVKE